MDVSFLLVRVSNTLVSADVHLGQRMVEERKLATYADELRLPHTKYSKTTRATPIFSESAQANPYLAAWLGC
jgi:hypothetical protein